MGFLLRTTGGPLFLSVFPSFQINLAPSDLHFGVSSHQILWFGRCLLFLFQGGGARRVWFVMVVGGGAAVLPCFLTFLVGGCGFLDGGL